jgi:hypothetical protein
VAIAWASTRSSSGRGAPTAGRTDSSSLGRALDGHSSD